MKISPLVDHLIESFQCLPGVGPKSAQRMVFYLLERDREAGEILSDSLKNALKTHGNRQICVSYIIFVIIS